jgi:predicted nuclease of restriction endonuclease-like RecB superfamily
MLTADLITARIVKGEVRPRYVTLDDPAALELARQVVAVFEAHVGQTRDALDNALAALLGEGTEFLLHRGLAKLLSDRATFEVKAPCEPALLRRRLFEESAKVHPAVQVADAVHKVTRDDIVARVAAELGVDAAAVTAAMYADLEGELVMTAGPDLAPDALLRRYNVALAQAVLLRATSLTIEIAPGDPARYRQLFRYVKFYRLMHAVEGRGESGYRITLDGPMSLFQLSQKYGLQLAEFLPALLLCAAWRATAEVRWGKEKRPMLLRLSSEQGLVSHYPDKGVYVTREEQFLLDRFADLDTPWTLERRAEVIDLGGRGVLIPELVMRHKKDRREALIDVMGFWRKEYLDARLALLREEGPKNLILLAPWRMRGDEGELSQTPAEVVFYKDVIPAKELIERAEKVGKAPKR